MPIGDVVTMRGGLIVSCQAGPGNSLDTSTAVAAMAASVVAAGTVGIRARGAADIRAMTATVGVPVMGLTKRHIRSSPIYSTPTWEDVHACIAAGADIIALDATERARPDGLPRTGIMCLARACTDALLMADVAQLHEGEAAAALSFDFVSTMLAGYPETSPPR